VISESSPAKCVQPPEQFHFTECCPFSATKTPNSILKLSGIAEIQNIQLFPCLFQLICSLGFNHRHIWRLWPVNRGRWSQHFQFMVLKKSFKISFQAIFCIAIYFVWTSTPENKHNKYFEIQTNNLKSFKVTSLISSNTMPDLKILVNYLCSLIKKCAIGTLN
jgi:hypothetical protein